MYRWRKWDDAIRNRDLMSLKGIEPPTVKASLAMKRQLASRRPSLESVAPSSDNPTRSRISTETKRPHKVLFPVRNCWKGSLTGIHLRSGTHQGLFRPTKSPISLWPWSRKCSSGDDRIPQIGRHTGMPQNRGEYYYLDKNKGFAVALDFEWPGTEFP